MNIVLHCADNIPFALDGGALKDAGVMEMFHYMPQIDDPVTPPSIESAYYYY
jgi:hypothetical protein